MGKSSFQFSGSCDTLPQSKGGGLFALLAAAIISSGTLVSQISEMLAARIEPHFSVSCGDADENRLQVIDEIANLYGYFLTYGAHEEKSACKLRAKGMWLEVKSQDDYFPTLDEVHTFVQVLKRLIEADLAKDRPWGASTKLGVDYGPELGVLNDAFRETGLDVRCNLLLYTNNLKS
ncbi:MAG: hypothetical protein KGI80_04970 [Verrucomicrobiota bacterium]|nr:hypothetical protein [Verrucomicrobiota bacterium]